MLRCRSRPRQCAWPADGASPQRRWVYGETDFGSSAAARPPLMTPKSLVLPDTREAVFQRHCAGRNATLNGWKAQASYEHESKLMLGSTIFALVPGRHRHDARRPAVSCTLLSRPSCRLQRKRERASSNTSSVLQRAMSHPAHAPPDLVLFPFAYRDCRIGPRLVQAAARAIGPTRSSPDNPR